MGSKTKTETKSTTKTDPWKPAQPLLNQSIEGINSKYHSDYGRDYFPGLTYTPASDATNDALAGIERRATEGSALNRSAQDNLLGYMDSSQTNPTNDFYRGGMEGDFNVSTDNYNKFMQDSQNPANAFYNDIAGGNNPYIDGQFERAADGVSDQINSVFSKAGRYGSTAHQGKLADDIGDMANSFYGNQYNQDMNRRMNASGAISNDYNNNINQQMNAAGSIANIEGANVNTALNSAAAYGRNADTQDRNRLRAIAMANGVANSDYQDLDRQLAVGGAREGYDQQVVQDAMNRFDYEENNPIAREQLFAQLAGYMGSMGSEVNHNATTTTSKSGLGNTLGNIGAGIGLGSNLLGIRSSIPSGGGSVGQQAMMPLAGRNYGINAVPNYQPYQPMRFY